MTISDSSIYDYYVCFTTLRSRMSSILSRDANFQTLYNIFHKFVVDHKTESDIVAKVLCGKIGSEYNKQMALHSIPTNEFMNFVSDVCNVLQLNSLIELYSGLGLFASMYDKYINHNRLQRDVEICAYDGMRSLETSGMTYFDVQHKSLEKFILDETTLDNKMCVAILPDRLEFVLDLFLSICTPACLILVVPWKDCGKIIDCVERTDYYYVITNTKILTYLDHYNALYNQNFVPNTRTFVITPNEFHLNSVNYVEVPIEPIDKSMYTFNECLTKGILPYWMLTLRRDEKILAMDSIYDLIGNVNNTTIQNKLHKFIANNITSMQEFKEYIAWKPRPPIYCTKEKFLEYRKMYQKLCQGKPLSYFHRYGIMPRWIRNIESAKIFLYLEYEVQDKLWKQDEAEFNITKQPLMIYFENIP